MEYDEEDCGGLRAWLQSDPPLLCRSCEGRGHDMVPACWVDEVGRTCSTGCNCGCECGCAYRECRYCQGSGLAVD